MRPRRRETAPGGGQRGGPQRLGGGPRDSRPRRRPPGASPAPDGAGPGVSGALLGRAGPTRRPTRRATARAERTLSAGGEGTGRSPPGAAGGLDRARGARPARRNPSPALPTPHPWRDASPTPGGLGVRAGSGSVPSRALSGRPAESPRRGRALRGPTWRAAPTDGAGTGPPGQSRPCIQVIIQPPGTSSDSFDGTGRSPGRRRIVQAGRMVRVGCFSVVGPGLASDGR